MNSKNMNTYQEIMIQRLVDNELDEQQRIDFLKQAESDPCLWRQISLAFVEEQVWSKVVGQQTNRSAAVSSGAGTEKVNAAVRPWWTRKGPQLLMTAASVLFVLVLAMRFNPVDPNQRNLPPDNGFAQAEPESSQGRNVSEPYRLQFGDVQAPVYDDPERFAEEVQRSRELDPQLIKGFQDAGYRLVPHYKFAQVQSQDGRYVLMPVQEIQVVRIGQ